MTRKPALLELLEATRRAMRRTGSFGGFSTIGWSASSGTARARRVYQSPGPIYEPEGRGRRLLAHRARHVRGGFAPAT